MSFEEKMKQSGNSVTSARRSIYKLLKHVDMPMSIQEIAGESPTIDRATVYRTIELFEKLGIVKRVWFGFRSKVELSDLYQEHHHHLVCESCGRIIKIDHANLERMVSRITKKNNYLPTKHHIEIFGLCEECQLKK